MDASMKLSSLVLAAGLSVFLPTGVMAGAGEVLFVNSFEGSGNVPQFVPVDEQATAAGRLLVVDADGRPLAASLDALAPSSYLEKVVWFTLV